MEAIIIENESVIFPKRIIKKLKGKKFFLFETNEGILLKPETDIIKSARGSLKSSSFSTKKYLKQKEIEKSLET